MIANITLDESIKLFNSKGGTRTKQVKDVFNKLGIKTGDTTRINKNNIKTDLCMVTLHFKDSKDKHWTIWNKDKFYDPDIGIIKEYPKDLVRETSFLPIYKK